MSSFSLFSDECNRYASGASQQDKWRRKASSVRRILFMSVPEGVVLQIVCSPLVTYTDP